MTVETQKKYIAPIMIGGVISILMLYPPLYLWHVCGIRGIFNFFADDTYYYLTVAKNSLAGVTPSFDGETLTNGFHPLWQYFLILMFKWTGSNQETQIVATFLACCLLTTAGLDLAALAVYRRTHSLLAAFWLIPGIFFILFRIERNIPGTLYSYSAWSFINGMETPLTIFFGGAILLLLTRTHPAPPSEAEAPAAPAAGPGRPFSVLLWAALGLTFALCVLARLDDIFLVAGFILFIFLRKNPLERKLKKALLVGAPTFLAVTAYIAYNLHTVGVPLPVSGQMKNGNALSVNLHTTLFDYLPPLHDPKVYSLDYWQSTACRTEAMIFPMVLAVGFLFVLFRRRRQGTAARGEEWLVPLLAYILLKGLHNLARVHFNHQGYWYYPLVILIVNYTAIRLVHGVFKSVWPQLRPTFGPLLIIIWLLVYLVTSASVIDRVHNRTNWTYGIWKERAALSAKLKKIDPKMRLIDNHDGIIGYALDLPTLCGTGLVTNLEGLHALQAGHYWEYCLARGYTVLGGNRLFSYAKPPRRGWAFKEILADKASDTVFYAISKTP